MDGIPSFKETMNLGKIKAQTTWWIRRCKGKFLGLEWTKDMWGGLRETLSEIDPNILKKMIGRVCVLNPSHIIHCKDTHNSHPHLEHNHTNFYLENMDEKTISSIYT